MKTTMLLSTLLAATFCVLNAATPTYADPHVEKAPLSTSLPAGDSIAVRFHTWICSEEPTPEVCDVILFVGYHECACLEFVWN